MFVMQSFFGERGAAILEGLGINAAEFIDLGRFARRYSRQPSRRLTT